MKARNFPGYQAGASLKPRVVRLGRIRHGRNFPGYQAGASLKLTHQVQDAFQADQKLPRLPSRGLIEASASGAEKWLANSNFPGYQAGASLKRREGGRVAELVVLTSPVTKPGPH